MSGHLWAGMYQDWTSRFGLSLWVPLPSFHRFTALPESQKIRNSSVLLTACSQVFWANLGRNLRQLPHSNHTHFESVEKCRTSVDHVLTRNIRLHVPSRKQKSKQQTPMSQASLFAVPLRLGQAFHGRLSHKDCWRITRPYFMNHPNCFNMFCPSILRYPIPWYCKWINFPGRSASLGSPAAQKSGQVEVHRGLLGLAPCSNMILTLKKMLKSRKSSCWNTTSYIDAIHQYLLKVFLYSLHFLYPE